MQSEHRGGVAQTKNIHEFLFQIYLLYPLLDIHFKVCFINHFSLYKGTIVQNVSVQNGLLGHPMVFLLADSWRMSHQNNFTQNNDSVGLAILRSSN